MPEGKSRLKGCHEFVDSVFRSQLQSEHRLTMIFDLHVHSVHGSRDSVVSLEQLAAEARAMGLDGMALVEHDEPWDPKELAELSAELGVLFIPAREVQSDMGHIIAFGLSPERWGITKLEELRQEADNSGGYLVSAHPFRYLYDTSRARPSFLLEDPAKRPVSIEEASGYPVFRLVDAIEAVNAHNKEEENTFAWETAQLLNKRVIGGSDVHGPGQLGDAVTVFPSAVKDPDDFLQALRDGGFYPATWLKHGRLTPFARIESK